jgi:Tfp pilus assembly protein PilF
MMNSENIREHQKIELLHQSATKLDEAGEYQRALDLLQYASEIAPANPATQVLIGMTYQSLNQNNEAEKSFRKAIELDPLYNKAIQSLGLFLISNGHLDEGAECLHSYLSKGNWNDHDTLQTLATTLMDSGKKVYTI